MEIDGNASALLDSLGRRLFRESNDSLLLINADATIIACSESVGVKLEAVGIELLGRSWFDLWESPEKELAEEAMGAALQSGRAEFVGFAYTLAHTPKWWRVRLARVDDASTAEPTMLVTSTDITELHLAEKKIRELNIWLEQRVEQKTQESVRTTYQLNNALNEVSDLYNNAPCGYFSLSSEGRFVEINDTALKWLGCQRDQILKRNFENYLQPANVEKFLNMFANLQSGQQIDDEEFTIIRSNGSKFNALMQVKPEFDYELRFRRARFSMSDITARKNAEMALIEVNRELSTAISERSAALEISQVRAKELAALNGELESFSYSVSHDLRAPLRRIIQYSEITLDVLKELRDKEISPLVDVINYVGATLESSRHMNELILALLELGRLGGKSLQRMPVQMKDLLMEAWRHCKEPYGDRNILMKIKGAIEPVMVDALLMRQVWENLISNALKYSKKREVIAISIEMTNGEEGVRISISDNGVGIPSNLCANLFGVFQRMHSPAEYEGNGVGLALCKRIIEKHGGKIWGVNNPDQGCTFTVLLPRTR